jgi:hypothetical protein
LHVADTPEFIQSIAKSIRAGEELARKSGSASPDPEALPKSRQKLPKSA